MNLLASARMRLDFREAQQVAANSQCALVMQPCIYRSGGVSWLNLLLPSTCEHCLSQLLFLLLLQTFRQSGVEKFTPLGEKFDPNVHSALFQAPDPNRQPGTVMAVMKVRRPGQAA